MASKANKSAPAPKLAIVATTGSEDNVAAPSPTPAENVPATPVPASKGNFWAKREKIVTEMVSDKMAIMGDVRQSLEHARQLYSEGGNKANEAQEIAGSAAKRLYQARVEGSVSNDEISATLGDIFGYKVKGGVQAGATPTNAGVPKDYTVAGKAVASKTPWGPGEAIRKRINRASEAAEYVGGDSTITFFAGLPVEEIADVLDGIEEGGFGLWSAYDKFAKIKSEHATRVEMAFDPKKIGTIVGALAEEGAAAKLLANPELVAAYQGLVEVLNILGETLGEMEEAA